MSQRGPYPAVLLGSCRACGRSLFAHDRMAIQGRSLYCESCASFLAIYPVTAPDDAACQRSFTAPAVAVFVLYWLLWLPGFFANILFLIEAQAIERRARMPLPGVGALRFMFWFQVWAVPVTLLVLALLWLIGYAQMGAAGQLGSP